jgi:hypothetical protein
MRRVISFFGICLSLISAAVPAFGQQQRLLAKTDREIVELDPRQASLGTVIRRFPLPAAAQGPSFGEAVPFGGGAFLAYITTNGVFLVDTRNGAVQRFTFPGLSVGRIIGTDGSARLLVSFVNSDAHPGVLVADARSGNVRFIELGLGAFPMAYASAANVLFVARCNDDCAFNMVVDVLDVATGTLLKTFAVEPSLGFRLLTNAAGTRLFWQTTRGMFVYDVLSGVQTARSGADELARGIPVLDEVRRRLLVLAPFSTRLTAFAVDSLQPLGSVMIPRLPRPPNSDLQHVLDVNGQSATIFVLQGLVQFPTGACPESQLLALDVATGSLRNAASTTAALGESACQARADLVRITEPGPPQGLGADVAGHQVTLKWRAPFGATHYEVEAGIAPGHGGVMIQAGENTLVVDDVPPGTYFVRVRAINTIGKSSASQEVRLVVE